MKEGQSLQRVVGLLDLTAARPRRDHRHRHLRRHRRGDRRLRPGHRPVVRPRGHDVRVLRARLRRALLTSIPVSGSACLRTPTRRSAKFAAWIIGWDLILGTRSRIAAVTVGWNQYFNDLADSLFGFKVPAAIANPPGEERLVQPAGSLLSCSLSSRRCASGSGRAPASYDNGVRQARRPRVLPRGRRDGPSTRGNLHPSRPRGLSGVVTASSIIFFAYIGPTRSRRRARRRRR